jgi:uncharacterized membrane protein YdjX (TVP38/TMEM64 family)
MTTRHNNGGLSGNHSWLVRWGPLVVVILCLAIGYALGLDRYISLDAFRRYRGSLADLVDNNAGLAVAGYVLVYIVAVAISFPGASALTVAGGLMFGWLAGGILAALSATIGATMIFLVARTSLGSVLAKIAGPRVKRLSEGFRRDGFRYLLFLRLVPIFPFWLVNLAAGIFEMRLLPYIAATAVGILPATFIFAYFGEGLGTALDRGGSPVSFELLVAIALLGVLVIMPLLYRRWRGSRQTEDRMSN